MVNSSNSKILNNIIDNIYIELGKKITHLHEPHTFGNEYEYVKKCIEDNMISSMGKYINTFENIISTFTKVKYCVSTVNGTSALHLSLLAEDVKTNDEVIMPSFNYVAAANVTKYIGSSIIFLDINNKSLTIDIDKLKDFLKNNTYKHNRFCINKKTNKRIKAIIVLHTFGHPANLAELVKISKDYNISLIEDAAEAIGSQYYGSHVGTFGSSGILSFNGNKTISAGNGGMILTNSKKTYLKVKKLASISKKKHPWNYDYDEIGYNYKLSNINAAIGCAQMENINFILKKKRQLFKRYKLRLKKFDNIKVLEEPKNCKSNYWLQTLIFKKPDKSILNQFLKISHKKKIYTRPAWNLLHRLNYLKDSEINDLTNSKKMVNSVVNLPSSSFL